MDVNFDGDTYVELSKRNLDDLVAQYVERIDRDAPLNGKL